MIDNSQLQQDQTTSRAEASDTSTDNILTATGELDAGRIYTELRLSNGQALRVPTAFFFQSTPRSEFEAKPSSTSSTASSASDTIVLPVVEEQLNIGKRTVATGTVRLEKHVQEYQEGLDVPLAVRTFDVERVVLNQPVETPPPIRQEGNTTVYSLVEEQLVLTTHLILKEEVRVTQRDTERRDTRTVTLKRETIDVVRSPVEEVTTPR